MSVKNSRRFSRIFRSISSTICFAFRFYFFLIRFTQICTQIFERIDRISRRIGQWIKLIRSIFVAVELFISTLMIFFEKFYQISVLLTILSESLANRSFDKILRTFTNGFADFYSSNGACYTLKDRTNQIIRRVRARWKRSSTFDHDDEIFYDTYDNEEIFRIE